MTVALLHRLPTFTSAKDRSVHVVVECPRGSSAKLKYEPKLGAMTFGRPLPAGVVFPHDFGFVPSTKAEDGDPLDAMVLGEITTAPGVVVVCRPVAIFEASQKEEGKRERVRNDRVMFVASTDERTSHVKDLVDLPERLRDELAAFFLAAVKLEGKDLHVLGWGGAKAAANAIDKARR